MDLARGELLDCAKLSPTLDQRQDAHNTQSPYLPRDSNTAHDIHEIAILKHTHITKIGS